MTIISPLTGSDAKKIKDIPVQDIVRGYKDELAIDVQKYFKDLDSISIYEDSTGYRFYYPLTLAGDGAFYEELERYPWYYVDTKLEHSEAINFLGDAKTLLEIGCGRGEFLHKAKEKNINVTGLELNENAVQAGQAKGFNILHESIEDHAKANPHEYDVVCSFQVAEHIANIGAFMQASIDALKPGGKLIICVPNNGSVLFHTGRDIFLNMPPHHMGIWDAHSLVALTRAFPIALIDIRSESLQPQHVQFARRVAMESFETKLKRRGLAWIPGLRFIGDKILRLGAYALAPHIVGHSITAIYRKI
ncbi:MAG: putative methyltransferase [Parcubacteria group bacterium]|nr:putative methyltransferase [Parcubacteria group bacterium]